MRFRDSGWFVPSEWLALTPGRSKVHGSVSHYKRTTMSIHSRSGATALAVGMLTALHVVAAQAPIRVSHHVALLDQMPTQSDPTDPQQPNKPVNTWKLDLSSEMTECFITVQDETWDPK